MGVWTSGTTTRRQLLRGAGGLGAALFVGSSGALLSACSNDDGGDPASATSGDLRNLDYQLSWIKNVEFAGTYIALERGYYRKQGVKVTMLPGGPQVNAEATVSSGRALVGTSSADFTARARLEGAPLKMVAAGYQTNPFAIMSLAEAPLRTPKDLVGKRVGVQGTNVTIWEAFLKANDIDPASVKRVPAQFDPAPLVAHEVDGWLSFITNEPQSLKVAGVDTVTFLFSDFNYPMLAKGYITTEDAIADPAKRKRLVDFLKGEVLGWTDALADPELGARLAVEKYGKGLDLSMEQQVLQSKALNALMVSDDTRQHGLFWMSEEKQSQSEHSMNLAGIDVKAKDLFTLEILQEVHAG